MILNTRSSQHEAPRPIRFKESAFTLVAWPAWFTRFAWFASMTWVVLTTQLNSARAEDPSATPHASTTSCMSTQRAWVDDLARDSHNSIALTRCPPGRMIVRLDAVDGALDVELTQGDGPAFKVVSPWRVSPLVEVDDFSKVPAQQRAAFARLLDVLPSREAPKETFAPLTQPAYDTSRPQSLPWLAIVGSLLALVSLSFIKGAREANTPSASKRVLAYVGLFAAALSTRFALGSWGPFHVNGQGALWLDGALHNPEQITGYGPGYYELFHSLVGLGHDRADIALFALNGFLSATTPLLIFALARLLHLSWRSSIVAAMIVALDAVSIRVATTEAYHVPITWLVLATSVCASWWASSFDELSAPSRSTRIRQQFRLLAAVCFASQAARIHPMSWPLVALSPLPVLGVLHRSHASTGSLSHKTRIALTTIVAMVVVGVGVTTIDATVLLRGLAFVRENTGSPTPSLEALRNELSIGSLVVAALFVAALMRVHTNGGRLALIAAPSIVVMAWLRHGFQQSAIWAAAFDHLFLVMPLIAVVAALSTFSRARLVRDLAPAVVMVALVIRLAVTPLNAEAMTTDEHEYRWLRTWATSSSSDCDIVYVRRAGMRTFFFPTYLLRNPSRRVFGIDEQERSRLPTPQSNRCLEYVRPALCSSQEGERVCGDVERELNLERISREQLPAKPSSSYLGYSRDPVEVAVYGVVPR